MSFEFFCNTCKTKTRVLVESKTGDSVCPECWNKHDAITKRPTCATCPYYDATIEMGAPAIKKIGGCRWDPNLIPHKRTDEWCGQHPDFPAYIVGLKKS